MEVGCGEATTLAGVLKRLKVEPKMAFGFDISWSRVAMGLNWLRENSVTAKLFVADLFNIPLKNNSFDIVYTYHSLEPNGGREKEALKELLRVTKKYLVLFEPIYELAKKKAQERMKHHRYVQNLKQTVLELGGNVIDYRLLEYIENPLNPTGLILIEKEFNRAVDEVRTLKTPWQCPITHMPLEDMEDVFFSKEAGLAYPVLRGIPLLRKQHAVIASALTSMEERGIK